MEQSSRFKYCTPASIRNNLQVLQTVFHIDQLVGVSGELCSMGLLTNPKCKKLSVLLAIQVRVFCEKGFSVRRLVFSLARLAFKSRPDNASSECCIHLLWSASDADNRSMGSTWRRPLINSLVSGLMFRQSCSLNFHSPALICWQIISRLSYTKGE